MAISPRPVGLSLRLAYYNCCIVHDADFENEKIYYGRLSNSITLITHTKVHESSSMKNEDVEASLPRLYSLDKSEPGIV